jgi:hypothetical protein
VANATLMTALNAADAWLFMTVITSDPAAGVTLLITGEPVPAVVTEANTTSAAAMALLVIVSV